MSEDVSFFFLIILFYFHPYKNLLNNVFCRLTLFDIGRFHAVVYNVYGCILMFEIRNDGFNNRCTRVYI